MLDETTDGGELPDNAGPRGSIEVVLLLCVEPDVLLLVQLKPVQETLAVPADGLQTHLLRVLLIDGHLEFEVIIKLTLAEILKGDGSQTVSTK